MSVGGASSSAAHGILGGIGSVLGDGRGSSATRDMVPGIVGGTFSPLATMSLTTVASTYSAVAFPVTASVSTVAGIFDEFVPYKNTDWRFGHWSPVDSAYMEPGAAGGLNLTNVAEGQGYWLITKGAASAAATGLPAPVGPFQIPLLSHPGTPTRAAYNQIGNPFLFPVDVSKLQVTNGVLTFLLTDVGNTLTDNVVKGWTGSGYANVTVLNGRTSYWVRTKQATANVKLIVPYIASAAGAPEPALAKPAGADWAVAVIARQGEQRCEPVLLGATSLAPGPGNPLNLTAAPAPPGGEFLSVHVPRPDWGANYVRQFQPQAEHMTWDLAATGAEVPGEITLALQGFDVPEGTRFWLTDPAAGTTREIAVGEAVTFAATQPARGLRLEATASGAGTPALTPLSDALRFAYPNPFADGTGFTFALSRSGNIRVEIYDVLGRRVRQLERLAQGAGEHVLVWDGRDEGGHGVASGVYLARYRAGLAHGVRRLIRIE